jgi:N-acetyl-anhydromuramyl-L-alanine amidase AmpD
MDPVDRITIHHEGWTAINFDDAASAAERLDLIRKSHIQRLGAGDIGYHFVIDRAGRLWQGRECFYQGAHVRSNNEGNIGVMVLGNFDIQTPTDMQISTLSDTLVKLIKQYRVRSNRVYTHREINPTDCPGANLQPRTIALRAEASRAARIA